MPTPNVLEYTTSTNSTPLIVPTSLTNTTAGAVDGILLGLNDGEVVTRTGFVDGEVVATIGLAVGEVVTTIGLAVGEVVTTTGLAVGEVVTRIGLGDTGVEVVGRPDVGEAVSDADGAGDRGLDVSRTEEGIALSNGDLVGLSEGAGISTGGNTGFADSITGLSGDIVGLCVSKGPPYTGDFGGSYTGCFGGPYTGDAIG